MHPCLRRAALSLALLALAVGRADALATESFGKDPVTASFPTFSPDLLPVLNDPARVYWYEVNGDAFFYHHGDTAALNALLKRFAEGGKGREVVLHAGALEKTSLTGGRRVEADWYVHVPGGFGWSRHKDRGLVTDVAPAVHLHVAQPRPAPRATAAQIALWVKELDSDAPGARRRAAGELERQGHAAAAALREAREKSPSAEVRERARAILARLPRIDLDALVIPAGLTAVGPDDLVGRCTKGLVSEDYVIRGIAASNLSGQEPDRKRAVEGLL
ncbi:MAG: hypothetical protein ACRC33_13475, partial [Gemmataceae bacterium]